MGEEVRINVKKEDFYFFQIHKCERDKESQRFTMLFGDSDINCPKLEKEEVDQVKWFDVQQLLELLVG